MEAAMKTRRHTALVVLSLLAAIVLAGSGDAPAAALATRLAIPIPGTGDGAPESVSLSGTLQIVSTVIIDPLLSAPRSRMAVTLVDVTGTGLTSGLTYVAVGENRLLRRLVPSDHVDLT